MTNAGDSIAYASVAQPFGCAPPIVHCPICGQATIELDNQGHGRTTPCSHLAFIHVGAVGEFEYQSDDFARRIESLDTDDYEDTRELLAAAGYQDELLALEVNYGGMGCGPMWFTDVFGFDYDTLRAESE